MAHVLIIKDVDKFDEMSIEDFSDEQFLLKIKKDMQSLLNNYYDQLKNSRYQFLNSYKLIPDNASFITKVTEFNYFNCDYYTLMLAIVELDDDIFINYINNIIMLDYSELVISDIILMLFRKIFKENTDKSNNRSDGIVLGTSSFKGEIYFIKLFHIYRIILENNYHHLLSEKRKLYYDESLPSRKVDVWKIIYQRFDINFYYSVFSHSKKYIGLIFTLKYLLIYHFSDINKTDRYITPLSYSGNDLHVGLSISRYDTFCGNLEKQIKSHNSEEYTLCHFNDGFNTINNFSENRIGLENFIKVGHPCYCYKCCFHGELMGIIMGIWLQSVATPTMNKLLDLYKSYYGSNVTIDRLVEICYRIYHGSKYIIYTINENYQFKSIIRTIIMLGYSDSLLCLPNELILIILEFLFIETKFREYSCE